jgi:hypothetical protein
MNPDLATALFWGLFAALMLFWNLSSSMSQRDDACDCHPDGEAFDRDRPTYDWEDPL